MDTYCRLSVPGRHWRSRSKPTDPFGLYTAPSLFAPRRSMVGRLAAFVGICLPASCRIAYRISRSRTAPPRVYTVHFKLFVPRFTISLPQTRPRNMCHIPTPHVTAHRKHYFASVLRRLRPCSDVYLAAPTMSMSLARSPCQRSPGLDPAIVGAAMLNYLCAATISSRRYRYPSRRGASSLPSWPCFRRTRLNHIRHICRVPLSPVYIASMQPLLLVYRPSSLCQRATFVPALALAVTGTVVRD